MVIVITPKKINSIRSAWHIVKILRDYDEFIHDNSIFEIQVNGHDDYHVIISANIEDYICCVLNEFKDEYEKYHVNDTGAW